MIDEIGNLVNYIGQHKKETPVTVYIAGKIRDIRNMNNFEHYKLKSGYIIFGEYEDIVSKILENRFNKIKHYRVEHDRRKSAIPLLNYMNLNARIEPGAIIREKVKIDENAVIMMGAVINIGARIGKDTMIDMNAVIGSNCIVGKRVHVGAGAVISGVIEPPNALPCNIEDDVFIGANSVILEGINIGKKAVVAAGAVVCDNVPANVLVAGVPAKIIKEIDNGTIKKTQILKELRNLN